MADALGMSLAEYQTWQKNEADQEEARERGIDLWELIMRREGATEKAIEEQALAFKKEIAEAIGVPFEKYMGQNNEPQ